MISFLVFRVKLSPKNNKIIKLNSRFQKRFITYSEREFNFMILLFFGDSFTRNTQKQNHKVKSVFMISIVL